MSRGASSSTVIPIPILELGGGFYTLDNLAKVESDFGRRCCETGFSCPEAIESTPVPIERDDRVSEFSSSNITRGNGLPQLLLASSEVV